MMRFAELAAPWFETAEIIELHHDQKIDAPSGTAITTAQRMQAASGAAGEWPADPTEHEVYAGARGGAGPGGIRGALGAHARHGGAPGGDPGALGQTLTLRQDSYDRSSYMPGVVSPVARGRAPRAHPGARRTARGVAARERAALPAARGWGGRQPSAAIAAS
ncbi:MAG: dihydrodipicolinate reductase C-terminal domain-containing protein [Ilumatobacteraceae bacterium]